MSEVDAVEALYYPGIEFPSVAWLKAALLYWEGVMRIVPDGHRPDDPPEVAELARAGLVQNLSPAPFRSATTVAFRQRLADLLRFRGGKPIKDEDWCKTRGASKPECNSKKGVHLTEMEKALVKELESSHLLEVAGESARMPAQLIHLYQITMATEAAQQLFAAPVTDDIACDVAATYFSFKDVAGEPEAVPLDGLGWAQLYMPFPTPKAAAALSIPKLVALRTRYAQLRRAFRTTIQSRTATIATLPSVEAVRHHLDAFAKEVEGELELQRAALRSARVRDAWTIVGISAPVALGTGTVAAGGPPLIAAMGAFGTLGLGVADWYLQRNVSRRAQGHYLLSLRRDFGDTLMPDCDRRMRHLVHGSPARSSP